jgi:Ni,Fe-hydrogenase I large subunit
MWDPESWPAEAQGFSMGEGTRGSVGHWVSIANRQVSAYQVVDATTWNASPRDAIDRRGPMEEALVGTPVVEPKRPLEILRVIHSMDPCTACAVHAYAPGGPGPVGLRVVPGGAR